MRFSRFVLLGFIGLGLLVGWLFTPKPGVAHTGPPRLTLSLSALNPGTIVEIVGINLVPLQPITLTLGQAEREFTLGVVTGDWHGDFTRMVAIPLDAPEGEYQLWASVRGTVIITSDPFMIGPPHNVEEDSEPELAEEDGLLVAIPTVTRMPPEMMTAIALTALAQPTATRRVVVPSPTLLPATPVAVAPAPPTTNPEWLWIALGVVLTGIAGAVLLRWRRG